MTFRVTPPPFQKPKFFLFLSSLSLTFELSSLKALSVLAGVDSDASKEIRRVCQLNILNSLWKMGQDSKAVSYGTQVRKSHIRTLKNPNSRDDLLPELKIVQGEELNFLYFCSTFFPYSYYHWTPIM